MMRTSRYFAHQVLHTRLQPHHRHGIGQPFQPVAHQHEDAVDTSVLDLREQVEPVPRPFTPVTAPRAEHVAATLGGDG